MTFDWRTPTRACKALSYKTQNDESIALQKEESPFLGNHRDEVEKVALAASTKLRLHLANQVLAIG